MKPRLHGRATACANIALAKYWGKSPLGNNLTATPSLSLTLDGLTTRTEVEFDASLSADRVVLNGVELSREEATRVSAVLDKLRARTPLTLFAHVRSLNTFPTAAGLASSASGFAALVLAASKALDLGLDAPEVSRLAREASASAARSVYGGYVELEREAVAATPLCSGAHFPLGMAVAVVEAGPKPVGSTSGMLHTARTSPYYQTWVAHAPDVYSRVKRAVLERDFATLADAVEHSALLMHSTMITSQPSVLYWKAGTVELLHAIVTRRKQGHPEAFTMDAGPNVKVLTPLEHLPQTAEFLRSVPGVRQVLSVTPGRGASLLSLDGPLEQAHEHPWLEGDPDS